jgi:low molecular weight protein-tyrosine phosphatase
VSSDPFTVLVVCTGNLNRSALAAALLRTWAGWYLAPDVAQDVRVISAGLGAPAGRPMRTKTRVIAESLGADGSEHRATQITDDAVRSADLVLVASRDQVDSVLGLVPAALRTTFTIREAGRLAEGLDDSPVPASVDDLRSRVADLVAHRVPPAAGEADDVVDPQGKGEDAYVLMAQQEVPALSRLATVLFGMPPGEVAAYAAAVEAAGYDFDGAEAGTAPGDGGGSKPRGRRQA